MFQTEVFALDKAKSYFSDFPDIARTCARIAINQVSERGGMKMLRTDMEEQVAFPAGYLKDPRRLNLARKASDENLEAVIVARERPTSLARFSSDATPIGNRTGGLTVRVKPGQARRMPGAFLMRLRAGSAALSDAYNIGLAVRLKPGDHLNKKKMSSIQLEHNLYLLYGPSADQVFRSVAEEDAPVIGEMVEDEFFRQLDLRS